MKTNFHNKPRKPLSRGSKQMKRSGFKPKTIEEIKAVQIPNSDMQPNFWYSSPASLLKRSPLRKVSKDPLQKRHAVLWDVFSRYIRERDHQTCITCGKGITERTWDIDIIDAGHFIEDSTGGMALRYNEDNVHAQCRGCNGQGSSSEMRSIYEEALLKKIGQARVSELYRLQHQRITKDFDVEAKIVEFREKLKELRK